MCLIKSCTRQPAPKVATHTNKQIISVALVFN